VIDISDSGFLFASGEPIGTCTRFLGAAERDEGLASHIGEVSSARTVPAAVPQGARKRELSVCGQCSHAFVVAVDVDGPFERRYGCNSLFLGELGFAQAVKRARRTGTRVASVTQVLEGTLE
jgi:hypothetical protein